MKCQGMKDNANKMKYSYHSQQELQDTPSHHLFSKNATEFVVLVCIITKVGNNESLLKQKKLNECKSGS